MDDTDDSPAPSGAPISWRDLIIRTGMILLIVVIANLVLGWTLDRGRLRTPRGESGVINNARLARADILILGSSRAKHHYDDAALSRAWGARVFNAGQDGQGIPFARIVFEQVAKVRRPKVVILDVMGFARDLDRVHALDPWYFESRILRELPPAGAKANAGAWDRTKENLLMRIPAYRFSGEVRGMLKGGPHPDSGFAPLARTPAMAPEPRDAEQGTIPDLMPQLVAFVAEAKREGATVVLAFPPAMSADLEHKIVPLIRDFAARENIPFRVFDKATCPELMRPDLYRDAQHLHEIGAAMFTRIFAQSLRDTVHDALAKSSATADAATNAGG